MTVAGDTYTRAEELFLGNPIRVEPDSMVCDRVGCSATGSWLIPGGASLCDPCAGEFGVGAGPTYRVPLAELTGGQSWRDARDADYRERLGRLRPLARDEKHDEALDQLAAHHVRSLIASAQPEDE